MNLLADECCDAQVVEALREDGHDATYVLESMRAASDTQVLQHA